MSDPLADAKSALAAHAAAHAKAIDELHQKLSAVPDANQQGLTNAVTTYNKAHQLFQDDVLLCITH